MARLLRASRNAIRFCSFTPKFHSPSFSLFSQKAISTSSELSPETLPRSPLEAKFVWMLRNRIDDQFEFAPIEAHCTEYKSFTVEDQPAKRWITMRRKFGDNEDIKIKATMFNGLGFPPKLGDDSDADYSDNVDPSRHISLTVDISNGNGSEDLEFLCSAWPNCIEVNSVYLLPRNRPLGRELYMGRNVRKFKGNFQKCLVGYLEARGIDSELSVFLHHFMGNKEKVERIQWYEKVESCVHK